MLELKVRDENQKVVVLQFEHSLRSLSKWESKYRKPFESGRHKTANEMLDYFGFMLVSTHHDSDLIYRLSPSDMKLLTDYINESRTATRAPDDGTTPRGLKKETVTSELIYYWMTALEINWEAQDWHLTRCMRLIQITASRKTPDDKKPKRRTSEVMADWSVENEKQKKLLGIS